MSMSPSTESSNNSQLTLEPCHPTKHIDSIQPWVSTFNIFVSVYKERFTNETPQLVKYCEVVLNCGCECRPHFISTSHSPTSYTIKLDNAFGSPFTLKGLVGRFRPESSARDVSLTTFAINVGL